MSRAALATAQRRRQCATRIENKQIAPAKVFGDLVKARVLDAASRPIDYQQANLIATNATPFRRLLCGQLRRQRECEWRRHQKNSRTKSATGTKKSEGLIFYYFVSFV